MASFAARLEEDDDDADAGVKAQSVLLLACPKHPAAPTARMHVCGLPTCGIVALFCAQQSASCLAPLSSVSSNDDPGTAGHRKSFDDAQ